MPRGYAEHLLRMSTFAHGAPSGYGLRTRRSTTATVGTPGVDSPRTDGAWRKRGRLNRWPIVMPPASRVPQWNEWSRHDDNAGLGLGDHPDRHHATAMDSRSASPEPPMVVHADEHDDDDHLHRQPAAAVASRRYRRNHQLMAEIMNRNAVYPRAPKDWEHAARKSRSHVARLEKQLQAAQAELAKLEEELGRKRRLWLDKDMAFREDLRTCGEKGRLLQVAKEFRGMPIRPNACKTAFRLNCF